MHAYTDKKSGTSWNFESARDGGRGGATFVRIQTVELMCIKPARIARGGQVGKSGRQGGRSAGTFVPLLITPMKFYPMLVLISKLFSRRTLALGGLLFV